MNKGGGGSARQPPWRPLPGPVREGYFVWFNLSLWFPSLFNFLSLFHFELVVFVDFYYHHRIININIKGLPLPFLHNKPFRFASTNFFKKIFPFLVVKKKKKSLYPLYLLGCGDFFRCFEL